MAATNKQSAQNISFFIGLTIVTFVIISYIATQSVDCAPAAANNNNGNNGKNQANTRPGFFRGLFRRQTGNGDSTTTTESSNQESETDEPQTQTELDAQKFMDSLPNAGANNSGPSTFRERVSESFGLLRDGVNNQFRSLRENFSETVDELRDTWTTSQE